MFEDMIAVLEVNLTALVRTQQRDFLPCGNEKSLSVIARYRITECFFSSKLCYAFVFLTMKCIKWFCTVLSVGKVLFYLFFCHALVVLSERSHRMVEIARHIWRSSCPTALLKQGHLESVAKHHVQMSFEFLQGGRQYNLSGQPVCASTQSPSQ